MSPMSSSRATTRQAYQSFSKSHFAVIQMKTMTEMRRSYVAPYFPGKKLANWWVVVGQQSARQLLSIKRDGKHSKLPATPRSFNIIISVLKNTSASTAGSVIAL
jgi:preprotein translocase subunit Sec63